MDDPLEKGEGYQQHQGRKIDTAEGHGYPALNSVKDRVGDIVKKADNGVVRIGIDPGKDGPCNYDKNINTESQVNNLRKGQNNFPNDHGFSFLVKN
jgi:hypothetical protein